MIFCNGNCRNQDVYQCGELDKFIETVTEKVESLPAKKIAEVVDGFLQQYGIKFFLCQEFNLCRLLWS